MSEFIRKIRDAWDNLAPRDQKIVMAVACLFLLFLAWMIMVKPLQNKVSQLEAANAKLVRDYQIISAYVPANQNKSQQEKADRTASLEKAIDRVSKDFDLKVTKINRTGESASVEIGVTDSVTLFYFLNDLEKKYAIYVESIDLEPKDSTVKVRKLTLGRVEKK
jgi:type II secretory pathway component PulM